MDYDVEIFEEGGDVKRYTTNIDSYLKFMKNIEAILTAWMEETGKSVLDIQKITIERTL